MSTCQRKPQTGAGSRQPGSMLPIGRANAAGVLSRFSECRIPAESNHHRAFSRWLMLCRYRAMRLSCKTSVNTAAMTSSGKALT